MEGEWIYKHSNEELPEGTVRAYRLNVPEWATLEVEIEEDGILLKLTNNKSKVMTKQKYYFYKDTPINMAVKIDRIIENMSRKIQTERGNEYNE